MKEIREESKNTTGTNVPQGDASNQYVPLEDRREYIPNINQQGGVNVKKEQSAFTKSLAGICCRRYFHDYL